MSTLTILGGTFDPFHLGHLYLATQAAATFGGGVRIIPNGCPPHRQPPVATWRQRLAMCRLATLGFADINVSEEESPASTRYTVATLATLKQQHPRCTLLLIVGSDAFGAFSHWQQPAKILQLAHLLVAPRAPAPQPTAAAGRQITDKTALATGCGGFYLWRCKPPAVSASGCRAALAAGKDTSALLPAAVAAYIAENKLYQ